MSGDRVDFIMGRADTFEIEGELSMWRVDGVVYAVGIHPSSVGTHYWSIAEYLEYHAVGCSFRYVLYLAGEVGHRTYSKATFDGKPVGPDEILTIRDENGDKP